MKLLGKLIGKACLGLAAASLIPCRFKLDKENGSFDVGSLLWSVKKSAGAERDTYTVELLPFFSAKKAAEAPAETPVEAPAAEAEAPAEPG